MGDLEAKTRHVRDSAFWGAPVGTPLPLPKKPEVERRSPRVPAAWTRGEFVQRKSADEVVDDDHATLVRQIVDAGHSVYQDDVGDTVAIDASLVRNGYAPAAEVEGLLSDVKTMISFLPAKAREDKNGKPVKVAVIVPDGDPQLPLVTSNRQVLSGVTLGYTVMGTGVINLNPTLLIPAEDQPFALEMATIATSGPYAESQPMRLGTLVHESGHFMDGVLGSIPPVEVVSPTTGEPELVIRRKDGDFYRQMLRNFPRVDGSYASSSPQEAYAEAYAEWTLGDRRDAVWAGFADAYAFYYGWETDDVDSPKGLRLGGRKRLAVAGDGPQFAGGPAGIGAPEGSQGLKTRHVRDAAFWGAPVGTPLPLPKKPEPPMDVLHRYQAEEMRGEIDILKHQIENTEKTVESIRNGFSSAALARYVTEMSNLNKERQQRVDRYNDILAGKRPYPLPSDDEIDMYLDMANDDVSRRRLIEWHEGLANGTIPADSDYWDWYEAHPWSNPDRDALEQAKALVMRERVKRFGIDSDSDAVITSVDDYQDRLKSSLPPDAQREVRWSDDDENAAHTFKRAVQTSIYDRMSESDEDGTLMRRLVAEIADDDDPRFYVPGPTGPSGPMGPVPYDMLTEDVKKEVALGTIRKAISLWANSSGNDHAECVAMQVVAREEFGLDTDSVYIPSIDPAYGGNDTLRESLALGTQGRRAFLRAMYDLTQEWFKEQGIDAVVCMRGFGHAHWDEYAYEGTMQKVMQQPMSSWAVADRDTARMFGKHILMSIIPREKILSTPRTGFGCLSEHEIVTIADVLPAEVV